MYALPVNSTTSLHNVKSYGRVSSNETKNKKSSVFVIQSTIYIYCVYTTPGPFGSVYDIAKNNKSNDFSSDQTFVRQRFIFSPVHARFEVLCEISFIVYTLHVADYRIFFRDIFCARVEIWFYSVSLRFPIIVVRRLSVIRLLYNEDAVWNSKRAFKLPD